MMPHRNNRMLENCAHDTSQIYFEWFMYGRCGPYVLVSLNFWVLKVLCRYYATFWTMKWQCTKNFKINKYFIHLPPSSKRTHTHTHPYKYCLVIFFIHSHFMKMSPLNKQLWNIYKILISCKSGRSSDWHLKSFGRLIRHQRWTFI